MLRRSLAALLVASSCVVAGAGEPATLPADVPPVLGTAVALRPATPRDDGQDAGSVRLVVPKVAWEVIGERRPKREWPRLQVTVEEAVLTFPMAYHPATQLADTAQTRVLDLKGRRLGRDELTKRLASQTPVLVSVSGRMPDPFYLQCTKPDTLIVVLGIPSSPAPELLPRPAGASKTSMKGWELYVWQDRATTFFSLMMGTNRTKTDEEIATAAVEGLQAVQRKLDQLKKGESVFVHGRSFQTPPPAPPAKAVVEYCTSIGLKAR